MTKQYNAPVCKIELDEQAGIASRWIDSGRTSLWECKMIQSGYEESDISIHGVKRDSLKREFRSIKRGRGEFCTVEIIKFTDRDGVNHSISLFS
jgi:hypothetical protein